jgi:hypothetical protein
MRHRETSTGEHSGRRRLLAAGVAGMLALTLAACTSGASSAKAPARRTVAAAPPAEGCIAITATDQGRPPDEGSVYAFTLIGRWNAGTQPVSEQLIITAEPPNGSGTVETQPAVSASPDGALPEPLSYQFQAAMVAVKYAVQGTITLTHGPHKFTPVTPYCETTITVAAAPYQDAPEGTVTVHN